MQKIAFLLFLSLGFCCICPAQEQRHSVSNTSTLVYWDTIAIKTAIDKAQRIAPAHIDSSVTLLKEALRQSLYTFYIPGVRDALGNLMTALEDKQANDEKDSILNRMAWFCNSFYLLKPVLPLVYNNIALGYQKKEDTRTASIYYLKAIAIAEKIDSASLMMLYSNYGAMLGNIALNMDSYSKQAISYMNKAEYLARKYKVYNVLASTLLNKGNVALSLQNLDTCLYYYQQALEIARAHRYIRWELLSLSNIGRAYGLLGDPKKGIPFLKEAIAISNRNNIDPYYRNVPVQYLGNIYLDMKDYANAERYLLQSLHYAEKNKVLKDIIESNKLLSMLYAGNGNYKKAFEHNNIYQTISDSLRNERITASIYQQEVRYRTSEKDKALLKKQSNIDRQAKLLQQKNNIIIIVVSASVLLILLFGWLYSRFKQKQKILLGNQKIKELKAVMSGEEKEQIRLAQELHDGIGGMLAAVNMNLNVAKKANFENKVDLLHIMDMIQETTEEIRKTAHNLMPSALFRHNLKDAIKHYCNYVNKNGALVIDLNVHGDLTSIDKTYTIAIFRIVQELVQNVMKHAQASSVIIELERNGSTLHLIVEDDGVGFDAEEKSFGLGFETLRSRTNTLGGKLHIDSRRGTGTSISVLFDGL